jgi:hypothetical protein
MCSSGFRSNGLSIALRRTLTSSESGQPPPKRFDPQAEQKVLAEPSAGWYVRSSTWPSRISIAPERTRPLTVPVPPESFLQLVQWHCPTLSNGPATSKCTPPHKQLPCNPDTDASLPPRVELPPAERRRTVEECVQGEADELAELEQELLDEVAEIDATCREKAADIETVSIRPESADVRVTELTLVWVSTF